MFKKHGKKTINTSIRIYKNKIENRITFKIKSGYYVELLTLVTMKLLGSTKSKITKDKKGENVPYLEINEVVLIHRMLLIIVINKIQEFCLHLLLINHLVSYYIFHLKMLYF